MDKATWALIISAFSLGISAWRVIQDRSRLHIESTYHHLHPDYGPERICFRARNKGRRPIYLRAVGGDLKRGGFQSTHMGDTDFGMKLEEGQYYDGCWYRNDLIAIAPDNEDEYVNIWLEDSLGNRYRVPKSKKYVRQLAASADYP